VNSIPMVSNLTCRIVLLTRNRIVVGPIVFGRIVVTPILTFNVNVEIALPRLSLREIKSPSDA